MPVDVLPLQQITSIAVGFARGRYRFAEDVEVATSILSAKIRPVIDFAVYDCLVELSWSRPPVLGFFGQVKRPGESGAIQVLVQVHASTGDVVGFSEVNAR